MFSSPVEAGAVVLLVVLAVLQELAGRHLGLEPLARDEVVVAAVNLPALLGPRRVCNMKVSSLVSRHRVDRGGHQYCQTRNINILNRVCRELTRLADLSIP